ncbi:hypothetical protein [Marinomonas fungiae]|uniref:hypothetical protein n=1 Tax=Marinomonas fungiae TaxID=1137284 RepID=UPI003A91D178
MKLNITNSAVTDLPTNGEWVFIQSAVGDIDVTFVTETANRTITIGQGEMIKMSFKGLQFQARGTNQEIQFRLGFGEYTPNITAVTSTIIDQIKQPVEISGISSALSVQRIADPVAVSAIADPVAVSAIADPVAVSAIADPVAVSAIAEPVVVAGVASVVEVETVAPVEMIDNVGAAFKSNDYLVSAGSYVDIPERDRSQIMFQNVGENETRCRVSNADAQTPSGMWLIGGGSLFGESPILRTKAALRVWNTSTSDAVITVNEVY